MTDHELHNLIPQAPIVLDADAFDEFERLLDAEPTPNPQLAELLNRSTIFDRKE